jgi:uncharacterized protein YjbI with pentapeptide repeats
MVDKEEITSEEFAEMVKEHELWYGYFVAVVMGAEPPDTEPRGSKLVLVGAAISDVSVVNANLISSELIRCELSRVSFVDCNFHAASLFDSTFRDCVFINCNFAKAELMDVKVETSDFSGSRFERADMMRINLSEANLTKCQFIQTWLIDADLRSSVLDHTLFEKPMLWGAKFFNPRKYTLIAKDLRDDKVDMSIAGDGSELIDSAVALQSITVTET